MALRYQRIKFVSGNHVVQLAPEDQAPIVGRGRQLGACSLQELTGAVGIAHPNWLSPAFGRMNIRRHHSDSSRLIVSGRAGTITTRSEPCPRHAMQVKRKNHTAAIIEIARFGAATMAFGHQSHDVETQAKMWRVAWRGLVAQTDQ